LPDKLDGPGASQRINDAYLLIRQALGETTTRGSAIALVNNGDLPLQMMFHGFVAVADITHHDSGVVELRGSANATRIVEDPGLRYSTVKDTAGKVNLYYEAGYKVQNKTGVDIVLAFHALGGELA
jgi:hypothetical protein